MDEIQDLYNKIQKIEKDFELESLEMNLKTSNIFRILKITKTEIRHSNFFAWLLDPNESHNLREVVLNRFLLDLDIEIEDLKYKKVEIRREWRNIDLLLIIDDHVICIENKVESKEHSNQLSRYKKIVLDNFDSYQKHYVYLTTDGAEASDSEYQSYSYSQLVENIDHILQLFRRNITTEVAQYMNDYSEILKIDIMKEHELNSLALKLYNRHKEAFDFIYNNKPDLFSDYNRIYKKKVNENGWVLGSSGKKYIRFQTQALANILPNTKGWHKNESFLFEIILTETQVTFQTTIAPGVAGDENHEDVRKILSECLKCIDGAITPGGKRWLVHFSDKFSFNIVKNQEKTDEEIEKILSKQFDKIKEIVTKVEAAILKRENELRSIKEQQQLVDA